MNHQIPERYLQEYRDLQKSQFQSRTALFIGVATGIYFFVSFFYLLRFLFGNREAFKLQEFYEWAALFSGSNLLYFANRRTRKPEMSKIYGHMFNIFLLVMVGRLGFLYPVNALVFPFYFALGLILVGFTIPWSLRELYFLSAVHMSAFSAFYAYVVFILQVPIPAMPRFHCFFDGLLFIFICAGLSVLLRKKRIERDKEHFLLVKEIEEKNLQIQNDLEFARRIHQTLMPESIQTEKADISVNYLPASYVGGDYAKFYFLSGDRLLFFICDVTGHGVAAALMVNRIHTGFEGFAKEGIAPGLLLQRLENFIRQDLTVSGIYLSAFCGMLDFKKQKLFYSNYGHPPQYLHQAVGLEIEPLQAHTSLLGTDKEKDALFQSEILCKRGGRIVLFTDGILEACSPVGEMFTNKRLVHFLKEHSGLPVFDFNEALLNTLRDFTSGKLADDVLLVTIQIH